MVTQDIVLNKHRIFSKQSYLYNIVDMINKKGSLDNVPSFKKLVQNKRFIIIGEFRRAEPGNDAAGIKGDPGDIIKGMDAASDAISILTEEMYFKGKDCFINLAIDANLSVPIIKRDFIISPLQLYYGKISGCSAVTMVTRIMKLQELTEYRKIAERLGIDTIAEVNDENDLEKALKAGFDMILINTMDYDCMAEDSSAIARLKSRIPEGKAVFVDCPEYSREYVEILKRENINGIFVGSDLLKHYSDPHGRLEEIRNMYGAVAG